MGDIINALKDTPIPTVLVWAGLFFILLTFVSKLGGMIEVQPNQKRWTFFIGLLLLTIGLVLSLSPKFHQTNPETSQPTNVSPTKNPLPSGSLITLSNGNLVSLESLQTYLQKQDFKNANKETEVLLFRIANLPVNKKRFGREDSRQIDCQGLKSIDTLWRQYSNNKFGLSTQKDILSDVQNWEKFAEKIGWKRNGKLLEDRSQLTYDLSAPIGHLPGVMFWISDDSNFYNGISCAF
jgi:GUN4-like